VTDGVGRLRQWWGPFPSIMLRVVPLPRDQGRRRGFPAAGFRQGGPAV